METLTKLAAISAFTVFLAAAIFLLVNCGFDSTEGIIACLAILGFIVLIVLEIREKYERKSDSD